MEKCNAKKLLKQIKDQNEVIKLQDQLIKNIETQNESRIMLLGNSNPADYLRYWTLAASNKMTFWYCEYRIWRLEK